MTDANHVLVKGPNGRHIEVHKTTQAAMPERFPIVEDKPSATAGRKNDKNEGA